MAMPARFWQAAALLAAAASQVGSADAATLSGIVSLAGNPLPIAVQGGTLAEASVHAVPFPLGSSVLDPGISSALDALLGTAATDCLLFAQVVGHVRPGTLADGDTRAAHRLARARADVVAAAMTRAGLPASLIGSTWDLRFATPEPRATLWLFERSVGGDCSGTPLPGARPAPVTTAVSPASPGKGDERSGGLEPAPGIHLPPPVTAAASHDGRADQKVAAEGRASGSGSEANLEPAPGIHLPAPSNGGSTPPIAAAAARSAGSEQAVGLADQEARALASVESALARSGVQTPEPQAGPAGVQAAGSISSAVVQSRLIVFDPDSSYPSRAELSGLEAWLATIVSGDRRCDVELTATVGDRVRDLAGEPALRYNEWLAERRQSRLADWLRGPAGCVVGELRVGLRHHDESRSVAVSIRARAGSDAAQGDPAPTPEQHSQAVPPLKDNRAPAAARAVPAPHPA